MLLLASGMFGIASLAFGEGGFDHHSIYISATNAGGRGGKMLAHSCGHHGRAPLSIGRAALLSRNAQLYSRGMKHWCNVAAFFADLRHRPLGV